MFLDISTSIFVIIAILNELVTHLEEVSEFLIAVIVLVIMYVVGVSGVH